MEPTTNYQAPQSGTPNYMLQSLPNATAVLVLGILSIVCCWCFGFVGLILGIIALVLSGKDEKLFRENPTWYTEGSVKNLRAGKVCAIIGTSISGLYVLIYAIYLSIAGAVLGPLFHSFPWNNF